MFPPYLKSNELDKFIQQALAEDVGQGDVSVLATIAEDTLAEGRYLAKADGVLSGLDIAERVFALIDAKVEVRYEKQNGDLIQNGTYFGTVRGKARSVLVGERLALNIMQRMSGIASLTFQMQAACKPHKARILDTRKTAPGLRHLDKYAVLQGGGLNHRIGLYDMVMIKDNHITAAGGISAAIKAAKSYLSLQNLDIPIEVETRTLEEVDEVLQNDGFHRIMLDNMTRWENAVLNTDMLSAAVAKINGRFETEASGNVTLETVPQIAATGVDFISSGALTHSVKALDISLKIRLI